MYAFPGYLQKGQWISRWRIPKLAKANEVFQMEAEE
jgi:hypothetical protein